MGFVSDDHFGYRVSVPSYVFALALSYNFGFKLGWFPMLFSESDIFGSSRAAQYLTFDVYEWRRSPVLARSEMLEVLGSD